jgi:hypothetical protein
MNTDKNTDMNNKRNRKTKNSRIAFDFELSVFICVHLWLHRFFEVIHG